MPTTMDPQQAFGALAAEDRQSPAVQGVADALRLRT
jgi:hypothetical protein